MTGLEQQLGLELHRQRAAELQRAAEEHRAATGAAAQEDERAADEEAEPAPAGRVSGRASGWTTVA
ncbi:hypothetical protein [Streptomyces mayteni]